MMKIAGMLLLLAGAAGTALAGAAPVPEIDASTGMSALALLGGAFLILKTRKNKK